MRLFVLTGLFLACCLAQESRQATGVKIGEVTPDSAIVWMRVTRNAARNATGMEFTARGGKEVVPAGVDVATLKNAAPGAPGRVGFRYGTRQDLSDARSTPWVDVTAVADYSHQFHISGLEPDTLYYYAAESAGPGGSPRHGALRGSFRTAPRPGDYRDVTFTVITGKKYEDLDHPDGFHIYESMLKVDPRFIVPTGDTVYYDSDSPRVTSEAVARFHWDRMYGFPRSIAFHLRVPGYWEKDDHDTYHDDCWPGMKAEKMGAFTFEQGLRIFRQTVPIGERTYRTARWGKALQVWFVEGRDFRSPNPMPDGPAKTIWGAAQKEWFKKTVLASDADWKVLVSPTPLVGPDRSNKADNHANKAFAHEGNEIRRWVQQHVADNFFIACGDRHWQYHSIDPETKVHEFSCGPASDEHAGGSPGEDPRYHRFHRVKGGFLAVTAGEKGIVFRYHDVQGKAVYEYKRARPAAR